MQIYDGDDDGYYGDDSDGDGCNEIQGWEFRHWPVMQIWWSFHRPHRWTWSVLVLGHTVRMSDCDHVFMTTRLYLNDDADGDDHPNNVDNDDNNGDDEEEDKYHDDDRQWAPDDHPDMGEEYGEEDADDDGGRVDSQDVPHPFHIIL